MYLEEFLKPFNLFILQSFNKSIRKNKFTTNEQKKKKKRREFQENDNFYTTDDKKKKTTFNS